MKNERSFEGVPVSAPDEIGFFPLTRQDIFERVVRHYRIQRHRCPPEGRCFYRYGGESCFVGRLIEDYHPDMEGYRARDLLSSFSMPVWFSDNIDFIEELQTIHDTETNWASGLMDTVLEALAARHGLTMLA